MIIVDANVLVHAVNERAPQHERARAWLDAALSGTESVGLTWATLLAVLRITTNPRIFDRPLSPEAAARFILAWLEAPVVTIPEPGPQHLTTIIRLLHGAGASSDLVSDAHLAAIALEHDADVVTFDRDFGRFPGIRWRVP